jgi:hypothetical protein
MGKSISVQLESLEAAINWRILHVMVIVKEVFSVLKAVIRMTRTAAAEKKNMPRLFFVLQEVPLRLLLVPTSLHFAVPT